MLNQPKFGWINKTKHSLQRKVQSNVQQCWINQTFIESVKIFKNWRIKIDFYCINLWVELLLGWTMLNQLKFGHNNKARFSFFTKKIVIGWGHKTFSCYPIKENFLLSKQLTVYQRNVNQNLVKTLNLDFYWIWQTFVDLLFFPCCWYYLYI